MATGQKTHCLTAMNLDPAFLRQMRRLLPEDFDVFMRSLEEDIPVSLRLNVAKCPVESAENHLPAPLLSTVPWCDNAFYLEHRPSFTFDPLFHCGLYYVQEASSMFCAQAIKTALELMNKSDQAVRMLDLCAAPGGKATLAASELPPGSLLVANEIIPSRAKILDENLIKWGSSHVLVTQNEAADFAEIKEAFDLILTDMPCSGEGMFRKEPEAIRAWSEHYVQTCAERQRTILAQSWNRLRPGGCLIYSTCTYNNVENEENVYWAAEHLGARILPIQCRPEWNIQPALGRNFPAYRFFPHKIKGEGFFLALLQKDAAASSEAHYLKRVTGVSPSPNRSKAASKIKNTADIKSGKGRTARIDKDIAAYLSALLYESQAYDIKLSSGGVYSAFPKQHADLLEQIASSLRIIRAGLNLGEYKAGQFIPDPALALSSAVDLDRYFPCCELDLYEALRYLKRESLVLSQHCPQGQVLLRYQGKKLGWANNLGSRANNRYVSSWKIRSPLPPTT